MSCGRCYIDRDHTCCSWSCASPGFWLVLAASFKFRAQYCLYAEFYGEESHTRFRPVARRVIVSRTLFVVRIFFWCGWEHVEVCAHISRLCSHRTRGWWTDVRFFPKAENTFVPPVLDEAEDGNHSSPAADLINPDGTMNDCFLGNPDITDGAMVGSVWKDSSDPRVFFYTICPTPKVLAYRIGPDLVPSECFANHSDNVAKGISKRIDPPPYVSDHDTVIVWNTRFGKSLRPGLCDHVL